MFQKSFSKKFILYTTLIDEDLDEIYRIRYQVYCEEYNYLDRNKYPDNRELDRYDRSSIHFVLRTQQGEIAASVRLILSSTDDFPIKKNFQIDLRDKHIKSTDSAEISRLIVAKKFRKNFLLLALIKGLFAYAKGNEITHVYAVLDDKLHHVLSKMGFPFVRIGPPSLYQGLTSPYVLIVSEMLENMRSHNRLLYRYLLRGFGGIDIENHKYSV